MADEAAEDFRSSLSDLTFNSKPLINMLTIVAEENVQYAEKIVEVIEDRIEKAAPSHKLPALYLMDSIIKNVTNSSYVQLFTKNIVATFALVFEKVDEKTRQAMFKLRQTWVDLFPNRKLYALDVRVNHIDPAWPITAQPSAGAPSIHVNPKFLIKQKPETASLSESAGATVVDAVVKTAPSSEMSIFSDEKPLADNEMNIVEDEETKAIREQMKARQQEILRLEAETLEIKMAEAKARLEQARLEQEARRFHAERSLTKAEAISALPVSQPVSAVPPFISSQNTTKVSAAGQTLQRDPRLKTDPVAAVLSLPVASSMNQYTAVVVPTQVSVEPTSSIAVNQVASRLEAESDVKVSAPESDKQKVHSSAPATGGNIFDKLQNLIPATSSQKDVAASASTNLLSAAVIVPSADKPQQNEKHSSIEKMEDFESPASPSSESLMDASTPAVEVPLDHSDNKNADSLPEGKPSKSLAKGLRGVSSSTTGKRRSSLSDKKNTSGGRSSSRNRDHGPVSKKSKQSPPEETVFKSKTGHVDTQELFGQEDKDIRRLPTIPKLQLLPQRQALLGDAPRSGLVSPGHSAAWANFKADHPDEFPFKQSQTRPYPPDVDTRKRPSATSSKHALLPTPSDDHVGRDSGLSSAVNRPRIADKRRNEKYSRADDARGFHRNSSQPGVPRPLFGNMRPPQRPDWDDEQTLKQHHGKSSLLGNMPVSMELKEPVSNGARNMGDNNALLPLPRRPASSREFTDSKGVGWQQDQDGATFLPDVELWDMPVKPDYDEDQFYIPEFDVRWCVRAQTSDRSKELYTVFIDDRPFEMAIDCRPRRIVCREATVEVSLDGKSRQLIINGVDCYNFGCAPRKVTPRRCNIMLTVFVRGPEKKIWIDDHLFEINVDSPPERIIIGGKEHNIAIDGAAGRIIVDGFDVCPYGTDEEQMVTLAFVLHKIAFKPPQKEILIDGNLCTVDLSQKYPVVWIDGKPRGIRFDGKPREIFIDDRPWLVPFGHARKCRIDGPKPRLLAFGGPGHEVIIDDQWFEVKFGGEVKIVKFGGRTHRIQLRGHPPEVKILNEIISPRDVMRGINYSDRSSDGIQSRLHHLAHSSQDDLLPPPPPHKAPGLPPPPKRDLQRISSAPTFQTPSEFTGFNGPQFGPTPLIPPHGLQNKVIRPLMDIGTEPIVEKTGSKSSATQPGGSTGFVQPFDSDSQRLPAPPAAKVDVDVNLLLMQLLAKGIISSNTSSTTVTGSKHSESQAEVSTRQEMPTSEQVPEESADSKKQGDEVIENIPSLIDFEMDTLRKRHSGAIQQLYVGIACTSCGLRFPEDRMDQYNDHLDWHFRQNRIEKESGTAAKYRQWFYEVVDWVQFEEVAEIEDAPPVVFESGPSTSNTIAAIPESLTKLSDVVMCPEASESENICEMCHEMFEQFWNEEHEAWHLKDAISIKGKIYHPVCYEDSTKENRSMDISYALADQSLTDHYAASNEDEAVPAVERGGVDEESSSRDVKTEPVDDVNEKSSVVNADSRQTIGLGHELDIKVKLDPDDNLGDRKLDDDNFCGLRSPVDAADLVNVKTETCDMDVTDVVIKSEKFLESAIPELVESANNFSGMETDDVTPAAAVVDDVTSVNVKSEPLCPETDIMDVDPSLISVNKT